MPSPTVNGRVGAERRDAFRNTLHQNYFIFSHFDPVGTKACRTEAVLSYLRLREASGRPVLSDWRGIVGRLSED
ncbi:hypothetical protein COCON_G00121970 [Conger conger]|uniref:Uncharacterized protein n=1 Tax=Conger conger TaxID=82655 RepID=A0A9Q1HY78_CONCO|nr:hypothetical protein COCON_G00121970 [Conger conger]